MRNLLLFLALAVAPSLALATIVRVDCDNCVTLRAFGNFGAAALYRVSGPAGPAVGNDRIWVDNNNTGRSVFVDVDTPITLYSVMGLQVPVPDATRVEINATWADGSGGGSWELPNEVLAALAATVVAAEQHETPEITPEEFDRLPGLTPDDVWRLVGLSGNGTGLLTSGVWVFSLSDLGSATPFVTIVECAWHSGC